MRRASDSYTSMQRNTREPSALMVATAPCGDAVHPVRLRWGCRGWTANHTAHPYARRVLSLRGSQTPHPTLPRSGIRAFAPGAVKVARRVQGRG